ncbi:MAG: hypothetical protein H6732_10425 [Alphaproteobacteria bacterium]|nr:hypothetical protein [Alphaproteobacteria bacterium]
MRVVFGRSPVAVGLAEWLARAEPTVLAGRSAVEGAFLWRQADLASGAGVKAALTGARRVYVVVDEADEADGLLALLARAARLRGAVVLPLGAPAPPLLGKVPGLSRVRLGPVWGPSEPLVASWARTLVAGGRVWLADPGVFRPLAVEDAVAYVSEAAERPGGVAWTVPGPSAVRLPELAATLAKGLGRPLRTVRVPLGWALRRAGVERARLERWLATPEGPAQTDGWSPSRVVGAEGWLGDPGSWSAG